MKVDKAIIPAAGLGRRMLPVTRSVPKELLPIGGKPMIQYAVEEAYDAGIRQIAIVTHPSKKMLMEYFTRSAGSSHESLKRLNRLLQHCEITFVMQPELRGLSDALSRCREFVGDRPFAVLLPDNIFFGKRASIRQMLPHANLGVDLMALYRYTPEISRWFGNCGRVDLQPFRPTGKYAIQTAKQIYQIKKLHDKKRGPFQMGKSKSLLVGFARQIFYPHVFDEIEEARMEAGDGEMDDVPVMQAVIQRTGMIGVELEGIGFDVGNLLGYAAANWWMANRKGSSQDKKASQSILSVLAHQ